jgi:hypothetical protein
MIHPVVSDSNKNVDIILSAESLTTWRTIPSGTNSPPEEVSTQ